MMAKHDLVDGRNVLRLRFSRGERLEMHGHEPETFHDIEVASGKIAVYGDGWYQEANSGAQVILSDDQMLHEILALEDGTEVLNVYRLPVASHTNKLGRDWFEISEKGD